MLVQKADLENNNWLLEAASEVAGHLYVACDAIHCLRPERKGQTNPGGALRRLRVKLWLWHWWHHGVKIQPWLAVDGRVAIMV
jgi:hypothetical protein